MTSTVLDAKRSFCFVFVWPGRNKVGPNTIAKLCSDILFSASCWCTLKWKVMKRSNQIKTIEFHSSAFKNHDILLSLLVLSSSIHGRIYFKILYRGTLWNRTLRKQISSPSSIVKNYWLCCFCIDLEMKILFLLFWSSMD